jgi:hypothetical protein
MVDQLIDLSVDLSVDSASKEWGGRGSGHRAISDPWLNPTRGAHTL